MAGSCSIGISGCLRLGQDRGQLPSGATRDFNFGYGVSRELQRGKSAQYVVHYARGHAELRFCLSILDEAATIGCEIRLLGWAAGSAVANYMDKWLIIWLSRE